MDDSLGNCGTCQSLIGEVCGEQSTIKKGDNNKFAGNELLRPRGTARVQEGFVLQEEFAAEKEVSAEPVEAHLAKLEEARREPRVGRAAAAPQHCPVPHIKSAVQPITATGPNDKHTDASYSV